MNVGAPLEAYAQTPEMMQPCVGSFDHPAHLAQPAAVRFSATRDVRRDVAFTQGATQLIEVITAVGIESLRPA